MDNQPTLEELEAVFGAPKKRTEPSLEELESAFGAPSEEEKVDLSGVLDPLSSFGAGMAKGVAGVANLPAVLQRGALRLAEKGYLPKPKHPVMIPTVEETVDIPALEQKPKTLAGEYAQTIGEFAPFAGRGVASKIRGALVPGVTSEAAGQLTKGTAAEPYARVAGAVLGGGAAELPGYLTGPRAARSMVTRATEGVTPEQIRQAEDLFNQSRVLGIPLTRAEALQQVTQGATSMADLQRVIEGQGGLKAFMAARPRQIETAARGTFGTVAPELERPELIGPAAGEAARGEVIGAHASRAQRTSPFYRQAETQTVEHGDVSNVLARLDELVASDPTGATHGPLLELRNRLVATPARPRTPPARVPVVDPRTGAIIRYETTPSIPATPERLVTDIGSLDRIRKEFRDRAELPAFAERAIDKETGSKINTLMDELNEAAEARSLQLRLGRRAHQEATRDIVEPVELGPTGRIAKEDITTQEVEGALFPKSPLPGSEESLMRTITAIEGREPGVARDLVRSHLERTFNEATQNIQSGEAPFGGAKFASVIAGNPQQRANLLTAINALPGGPGIVNGVEQLLNVLEATGRRQAIGSQTAFNKELIDSLKAGIPLDKAIIPSAVKNWIQGIAAGRNTEELSRLLTDPAAARDFASLASANGYTRLRSLARLAARGARYSTGAGAKTGQFSLDYDGREKRATGGKVSGGLSTDTLLKMADNSRKKIQNGTKELLEEPDESVVSALKVANEHI